MTQSKEIRQLAAIHALALDDLASASDEDLKNELAADGIDIQVLSERMRSRLDEVVGAAMRAKTMQAKQSSGGAAQSRLGTTLFPAVERMRELIKDAFARDPNLAVAFREGRQQSDADIESLYADLVQVGVIEPDGHER